MQETRQKGELITITVPTEEFKADHVRHVWNMPDIVTVHGWSRKYINGVSHMHTALFRPTTPGLPQLVEVLEWQAYVGQSRWVKFLHGCRSVESLTKKLRRMVRAREIMGYRFINDIQESFGL